MGGTVASVDNAAAASHASQLPLLLSSWHYSRTPNFPHVMMVLRYTCPTRPAKIIHGSSLNRPPSTRLLVQPIHCCAPQPSMVGYCLVINLSLKSLHRVLEILKRLLKNSIPPNASSLINITWSVDRWVRL